MIKEGDMRIYSSFLPAAIVLSTALLLSGCATPPPAPKTGVELQAYQAKEFETTKRAAFSATMSVFQDLGFIIDDGDFDTGLITATGPSTRDALGVDDVLAQLFVGVDVRASSYRRATAFVEEMPSDLIRIRLNFVDTIVRPPGPTRISAPVEQAEFYQATFEQIDKAIFVRSGSK
jgi:hypothetical protein